MLAVTPGDPGAVLRPEVNVVVSSRRAGAPPGLQHALRALPEWSRNVRALWELADCLGTQWVGRRRSPPTLFPAAPARRSLQVTARRSELPAAAASLLEPLRSLELRAALHGQLVDIAREYCDVLGAPEVSSVSKRFKF